MKSRSFFVFLSFIASSFCISDSATAQVILFPTIDAQLAKTYAAKIKRVADGQKKTAMLLDLAEYHLKKPGERKSDLDSCNRFLSHAFKSNIALRNRQTQLKIQIIQAILYHEQANDSKAKTLLHSTIKDAEAGKLYAEKAQALFELGNISNNQEKQIYYEQSATAFRAAGDTKRLAKILVVLSDWEMATGIFDKPYERLLEAIKYDQSARAYVLLGGISYVYRDQTEALKYGLLALEVAKKEKNQMREAEAQHRLGETYRLLFQDQNALNAFNAARSIMEKLQMMTGYYDVCRGIAYTYLGMGKTANAIESYEENMAKFAPTQNIDKFRYHTVLTNLYVRANDFKNANHHHEIAKSLVPKNENPDGIYSLTRTSAEFYYRFKAYDKARALFIHGNKVSGENVSHLLRIASIDSIQGNFQSALKYTQQAKKLNDSLLGENRSKLVAGLQIKFDLKQKEANLLIKDADLKLKDQHIEALNQNALLLRQKAEISIQEAKLNAGKLAQAKLRDEKNAIALKLKDQQIQTLDRQTSLQKLQLSQERFTRKVTIAFICLFLIVLVLLVRQYLVKQKNAKLVSEKNNLLEQLLAEKNWLLKEMHHRVKNNLQTVMSLLESQSAYLADEALLAIQNSQHRIFAMSLIHQKLYQSDEVKTIDMAIYIPELISYLRETLCGNNRIVFNLHVEPIEFDAADAVPLGLIVNEVVTNSLKYAFNNKQTGRIDVTLTGLGQAHMQLTMADNGVGLPSNFDISKITSLGLRLIVGLSQQLDAKLTIAGDQGTAIAIIIPSKQQLKATA